MNKDNVMPLGMRCYAANDYNLYKNINDDKKKKKKKKIKNSFITISYELFTESEERI